MTNGRTRCAIAFLLCTAAALTACDLLRTLTRHSIEGSPETNGMIVISMDPIEWTDDRFLKVDERHDIPVIKVGLERLDQETHVAVEDDPLEGKYSTSPRVFTFSRLSPGRYHVASFTTTYEKWLNEGKQDETPRYETVQFEYTVGKSEIPDLVVYVDAGEIVYVGNVHLKIKHDSDSGTYPVHVIDESTEVRIDVSDEHNVLERLRDADPEGPWAAALQQRLAAGVQSTRPAKIR